MIPVYNGEAHLDECLSSLLRQTFIDIEVICVDDCSTDGSLSLLRSYARLDSRIRVLGAFENQGSARARRWGVLESVGDYILFCDQDDSYERDACELLSRSLQEDPVDILQYGTHVVNEGDVGQVEIDGLSSWLEPYEGCLSGRDILDKCFIDLEFGYTIWNKVYRGIVARRAFSALEDTSVPLGEDNYESFALFFFARTYKGIPKTLYNYHYGRGYTGHTKQSAASFRRTCGLSVAADLIQIFLLSQGKFDEYESTYLASRRHMLRYTFDRWNAEISPGEQKAALGFVIDAWPWAELLDYVANERPRDLSALLDARFGPLDSGGAEDDDLVCLRRDLESLVVACQDKDVRVEQKRKAYENSRAYRWGRILTAPLRMR